MPKYKLEAGFSNGPASFLMTNIKINLIEKNLFLFTTK